MRFFGCDSFAGLPDIGEVDATENDEFYTGQFPGSFARGIPFQENLETGDMRISGTMASLAGLEQAVEEDDEYADVE